MGAWGIGGVDNFCFLRNERVFITREPAVVEKPLTEFLWLDSFKREIFAEREFLARPKPFDYPRRPFEDQLRNEHS